LQPKSVEKTMHCSCQFQEPYSQNQQKVLNSNTTYVIRIKGAAMQSKALHRSVAEPFKLQATFQAIQGHNTLDLEQSSKSRVATLRTLTAYFQFSKSNLLVFKSSNSNTHSNIQDHQCSFTLKEFFKRTSNKPLPILSNQFNQNVEHFNVHNEAVQLISVGVFKSFQKQIQSWRSAFLKYPHPIFFFVFNNQKISNVSSFIIRNSYQKRILELVNFEEIRKDFIYDNVEPQRSANADWKLFCAFSKGFQKAKKSGGTFFIGTPEVFSSQRRLTESHQLNAMQGPNTLSQSLVNQLLWIWLKKRHLNLSITWILKNYWLNFEISLPKFYIQKERKLFQLNQTFFYYTNYLPLGHHSLKPCKLLAPLKAIQGPTTFAFSTSLNTNSLLKNKKKFGFIVFQKFSSLYKTPFCIFNESFLNFFRQRINQNGSLFFLSQSQRSLEVGVGKKRPPPCKLLATLKAIQGPSTPATQEFQSFHIDSAYKTTYYGKKGTKLDCSNNIKGFLKKKSLQKIGIGWTFFALLNYHPVFKKRTIEPLYAMTNYLLMSNRDHFLLKPFGNTAFFIKNKTKKRIFFREDLSFGKNYAWNVSAIVIEPHNNIQTLLYQQTERILSVGEPTLATQSQHLEFCSGRDKQNNVLQRNPFNKKRSVLFKKKLIKTTKVEPLYNLNCKKIKIVFAKKDIGFNNFVEKTRKIEITKNYDQFDSFNVFL
jgi:hypothetical protein